MRACVRPRPILRRTAPRADVDRRQYYCSLNAMMRYFPRMPMPRMPEKEAPDGASRCTPQIRLAFARITRRQHGHTLDRRISRIGAYISPRQGTPRDRASGHECIATSRRLHISTYSLKRLSRSMPPPTCYMLRCLGRLDRWRVSLSNITTPLRMPP